MHHFTTSAKPKAASKATATSAMLGSAFRPCVRWLKLLYSAGSSARCSAMTQSKGVGGGGGKDKSGFAFGTAAEIHDDHLLLAWKRLDDMRHV